MNQATALQSKSFADVTIDEALARANALAPAISTRATRADESRELAQETLDDIRRAGLFRYMMPKRWGGMELPFPVIIDLPAAFARACASTSWIFHNFSNHAWILAMYDERAQEEVWGVDPDAFIAGGIAFPQGRGRRVEGGYVIEGFWNFCSGVDPSPWTMLAATIRDSDDGPPVDYRMCMVPREAYEIVDDWFVMGMRGTGSKSIRGQDIFVPEHRALSMLTIRGGADFPGARTNPGPLFRVPLVGLAGYFPAATGLGNAQAALALTIEQIRARETNYTGAKMSDFQAVQIRVAMAGAKITAAEQLMKSECARAWEDACAGRIPDPLTKLAYKRNAAFAVQLCTEAVDNLHSMAGAMGIYDRYPIQRIFRDAHALAGHISFSFDAHGSAWGSAAMGGKIVNAML